MPGSDAAPLLDVRGLVKSFFGNRVLHGIGFTLQSGRVLGLVGENGSGKSTTLNILAGVHRPDAGEMQLGGTPYAPRSPREATASGIAFMHQELNLFGGLSIAENLHLDGFPRRLGPFIDHRHMAGATEALLREVDLDLPPATRVARLSQGERQLVELAKALSRRARVIFMDEPTTSLTRREIDRLFAIVRRLVARGIGVVYVSHAIEDVRALCDEVAVLRDGHLVGAGGIAEMPAERIVSLMVGRAIETVFPPRPAPAPETIAPPAAAPTPVLSVRGLTQPGIAHEITFDVMPGEVVGLAGLMGAGRSELARMIFGLDPFARGEVTIFGRSLPGGSPAAAIAAGAAMLTEDRRADGLLMASSIAENIVLASLETYANSLGLIVGGRAVAEVRAVARAVHLSTDQVTRVEARHLSGGNQQKVVLGRWLLRRPRLFILDEPTRGIDIGAKQEIYRLIADLVAAGSGVLLIASEIEELIGLSDRILALRRGEIVAAFHPDPAFDREAIMAAAAGAGLAQAA